MNRQFTLLTPTSLQKTNQLQTEKLFMDFILLTNSGHICDMLGTVEEFTYMCGELFKYRVLAFKH